MNQELVAALLQSGGPLGVIIVGAGAYIVRQQRLLNQSQERRVADAQAVTGTILALVEGQNEAKTALAEAIARNSVAIERLREEILRR